MPLVGTWVSPANLVLWLGFEMSVVNTLKMWSALSSSSLLLLSFNLST